MKIFVVISMTLFAVLDGGSAMAARVSETGAGLSPAGVALDWDGRLVYVSGYSIFEYGGGFSVPGAVNLKNIVAGPDGFWLSDPDGNQVFHRPYSGAPTAFPLPTPNAGLGGMVMGPDGNIWFTEITANKIGRLTPAGTFMEFPVPTAGSSPFAITSAPDGNLYFVEYNGNKIGQITTSGMITEYPIPTPGSHPSGIAASRACLAFTESSANQIGVFEIPDLAVVAEHPIPTANSLPWQIVHGSDRTFYFTERFGNRIGVIANAGGQEPEPAIEYPVPTPASNPTSLVADRQGRIWFAESAAIKIGLLELSVPGDVNGDGKVDVSDVFSLINFLFAGGPSPK
jgi:virginiamycin B lyase